MSTVAKKAPAKQKTAVVRQGAVAMVLRPRVSEKSYALSMLTNTYVFAVPGDANRTTVADAVAAQFGVTVTKVNISNRKGKAKRTVRRGGRPSVGRDVAVKKAYVTLKEGDSIAMFAANDEQAEKPSKKEAK